MASTNLNVRVDEDVKKNVEVVLDELGLNNVITIEGSDGKIAETVIKTSKAGNQKILKLNSLQAVGAKEVKEGVDYISIMQSNLEVIKTGLSN